MSGSVTNSMPDPFRRLWAVGLSAPYIRNTILREWWDDQAAKAHKREAVCWLQLDVGGDMDRLDVGQTEGQAAG